MEFLIRGAPDKAAEFVILRFYTVLGVFLPYEWNAISWIWKSEPFEQQR